MCNCWAAYPDSRELHSCLIFKPVCKANITQLGLIVTCQHYVAALHTVQAAQYQGQSQLIIMRCCAGSLADQCTRAGADQLSATLTGQTQGMMCSRRTCLAGQGCAACYNTLCAFLKIQMAIQACQAPTWLMLKCISKARILHSQAGRDQLLGWHTLTSK